jgi:hypothetical protein
VIRYFHGGVPGLRPGDLIEPRPPHVVDGCKVCEAKAQGVTLGHKIGGELVPIDPPRVEQDRVYITPNRDYARFYASRYPRGDLYVVEPIGDLVYVGDEDPTPTFAAPAARIRAVYDRAVQLNPSQRRAVLRMFNGPKLSEADMLDLARSYVR